MMSDYRFSISTTEDEVTNHQIGSSGGYKSYFSVNGQIYETYRQWDGLDLIESYPCGRLVHYNAYFCKYEVLVGCGPDMKVISRIHVWNPQDQRDIDYLYNDGTKPDWWCLDE